MSVKKRIVIEYCSDNGDGQMHGETGDPASGDGPSHQRLPTADERHIGVAFFQRFSSPARR